MYQIWGFQCIKCSNSDVSNVAVSMYQMWELRCIKCGNFNVSNVVFRSINFKRLNFFIKSLIFS